MSLPGCAVLESGQSPPLRAWLFVWQAMSGCQIAKSKETHPISPPAPEDGPGTTLMTIVPSSHTAKQYFRTLDVITSSPLPKVSDFPRCEKTSTLSHRRCAPHDQPSLT
jgi:hypothetical protein